MMPVLWQGRARGALFTGKFASGRCAGGALALALAAGSLSHCDARKFHLKFELISRGGRTLTTPKLPILLVNLRTRRNLNLSLTY